MDEEFFSTDTRQMRLTRTASTRRMIRPERARSERRRIRDIEKPAVNNNHNQNFTRDVPVPTTSTHQQHHHPEHDKSFHWWRSFARGITCCFFDWCLAGFGMRTREVQQAWREKIALIFIILMLCLLMGFFTFALQIAICKGGESVRVSLFSPPTAPGKVVFAIRGNWYSFDESDFNRNHPRSLNQIKNLPTKEATAFFSSTFEYPNCAGVYTSNPPQRSCAVQGAPTYCHKRSFSDIQQNKQQSEVSFEWDDLRNNPGLVVYNGVVLDIGSYLDQNTQFLGAEMDQVLRQNDRRDITRQLLGSSDLQSKINCLIDRYRVGYLSKDTVGCFTANFINWFILVIILGLVVIRFALAVMYAWIYAPRMGRDPRAKKNSDSGDAWNEITPYDSASQRRKTFMQAPTVSRFTANSRKKIYDNVPLHLRPQQINPKAAVDLPYTMMLVTCYNEGEEGLRTTLESLASTLYEDRHKLFFIVCDGLVDTGNGQSCADIILNMIELDSSSRIAQPKSYVAVADGAKQHNMARVFGGYFQHNGHSVPLILVSKCGTPAEAKDVKPGNRGKRDSQLILMNFLSKVMFDDRMTELEFEMFQKIERVSGVTPDKYEFCLMVDADTRVMNDSLPLLVNAFENDSQIMGLCGETRIANKNASMTSIIQVYEYYISHHLAKNFESMWGGVTCLPGCFCMYRIKARKGADGYWVPLLCNPDIIRDYSENVVTTLHQKNLLLLGEDRYLTTLMLKAFPKRKMMFLPQAVCKTEVPTKMSVLMSQRRRWINSTIHNLMELVLVRDLCGLFCCSMNFVILLELIGSVVLPAAIIFTFFLIYMIATNPVDTVIIPLILLVTILFLPAMLVLINTFRRPIYLLYMIAYLIALPVWNFWLPVYAFWHFDDFSWGKTRAVQGDDGKGHGESEGQFDSRGIVLKRWEEWVKETRRQHQPRIAPRRGGNNGAPMPPPKGDQRVPFPPRMAHRQNQMPNQQLPNSPRQQLPPSPARRTSPQERQHSPASRRPSATSVNRVAPPSPAKIYSPPRRAMPQESVMVNDEVETTVMEQQLLENIRPHAALKQQVHSQASHSRRNLPDAREIFQSPPQNEPSPEPQEQSRPQPKIHHAYSDGSLNTNHHFEVQPHSQTPPPRSSVRQSQIANRQQQQSQPTDNLRAHARARAARPPSATPELMQAQASLPPPLNPQQRFTLFQQQGMTPEQQTQHLREQFQQRESTRSSGLSHVLLNFEKQQSYYFDDDEDEDLT